MAALLVPLVGSGGPAGTPPVPLQAAIVSAPPAAEISATWSWKIRRLRLRGVGALTTTRSLGSSVLTGIRPSPKSPDRLIDAYGSTVRLQALHRGACRSRYQRPCVPEDLRVY